jgi:hypothetical protein
MGHILTLFLSIFVILASVVSCGIRSENQVVRWREGDSIDILERNQKEINRQDWKKTSEVEFAGFLIEQKQQTISDRNVQGTYFNKVTKLNAFKPHLLFAQYKKKGIFPLLPDKMDPEVLINQFVESHSEYKKMKLLHFSRVLQQKGSGLITLWRAEFEDKTKVIEVLFSKNLEIFSVQILSSDFDVNANVFPRGAKHSTLTQVLFTNLLDFNSLSSSRVIVQSEAPNSNLNLKETLNYEPTDLKFDQVQAFYSLDSSLAWFETKFGYKPYSKLEADTNISYPEKTNAAFYYGGKIRIGTGDDVIYSHLAQDPSIVIHESAHSIIEAVAHLPVDGEGGSINEGFADFFACTQLQTPYLGEVSFVGAPYKRSLLTVVKLAEKTGGLYHDSLILSGLLWQLQKELGETTSLKIASRLLVEMNPTSDFEEVRKILPTVLTDVLDPNDLRRAQKILIDRGF